MTSKPVDTAIVMVVGPCIDDTDFKSLEESIAYDAAGMDVSLIVEKTDGTTVVTAITLTTGGTSDWTHKDGGYYEVEITAAQNAEEGIGYVRGVCTGVLPFESAHYDIVKANIYDSLIKGTDVLQVDVTQISGDSAAADNIEATYDGTGYTNDSAPATQEQVGRLATGSAAINTTAESFTKAGAEPETNTYTSTVGLDGVFHIVEDDAGNTDCYYQFDVGGNGVPVSVTWEGYAQSQGDSYTIWAYNYGTTTYEQLGTISCVNGTTIREEVFALSNAHVGTGANLGKARFRFLSTDGTAFATDRLLCAYAIVTKSVGYSEGAIWVNTNASNTNTEAYVDGTADNPVSTWAAAKTLSTTLGIKKFHIVNGSSITLDANSDNYTIVGHNYSLALGGQSLQNTFIEEANVSGIATAGAGAIRFSSCNISSVTVEKSAFKNCGLSGTITLSAAATYIMKDCFNSADGGTPPTFDFGAAIGDTHIGARGWRGGIEIANLGAAGSDVFSITGEGKVVIASTCAGGVLKIIGDFTVEDNVGGGFSGTTYDDARYDVDQVADAVWDEILTGATHNIATSAGRRVREIGAFAIHSGTAQGGNSHSITIAATASPSDAAYHGIYNRNLIVITDNTGVGQTRTIVDYDAITKVTVVDRDWRIPPDATTEYQITPDDTPLTVDHGVACGGTNRTITIRAYAASDDDAYLCNIVTIIAGAGRGQARLVDSYDGTTNIVTICGDDWVVTPDTTSVYVMMPYGVACAACMGSEALNEITDCVWDEDLTGHTTSKSAGWFVKKIKSLADVILAMVT